MDERDRRMLPLPLGLIIGALVAGMASLAVRLPAGAYDMQGMWTVAVSGGMAWIGSTIILLWLFRRNGTRPDSN